MLNPILFNSQYFHQPFHKDFLQYLLPRGTEERAQERQVSLVDRGPSRALETRQLPVPEQLVWLQRYKMVNDLETHLKKPIHQVTKKISANF